MKIFLKALPSFVSLTLFSSCLYMFEGPSMYSGTKWTVWERQVDFNEKSSTFTVYYDAGRENEIDTLQLMINKRTDVRGWGIFAGRPHPFNLEVVVRMGEEDVTHALNFNETMNLYVAQASKFEDTDYDLSSDIASYRVGRDIRPGQLSLTVTVQDVEPEFLELLDPVAIRIFRSNRRLKN